MRKSIFGIIAALFSSSCSIHIQPNQVWMYECDDLHFPCLKYQFHSKNEFTYIENFYYTEEKKFDSTDFKGNYHDYEKYWLKRPKDSNTYVLYERDYSSKFKTVNDSSQQYMFYDLLNNNMINSKLYVNSNVSRVARQKDTLINIGIRPIACTNFYLKTVSDTLFWGSEGKVTGSQVRDSVVYNYYIDKKNRIVIGKTECRYLHRSGEPVVETEKRWLKKISSIRDYTHYGNVFTIPCLLDYRLRETYRERCMLGYSKVDRNFYKFYLSKYPDSKLTYKYFKEHAMFLIENPRN